MERDREVAKLINVLRRIARAARFAAWTRDAETARFCATQYNKILQRLSELEPAVATLFTPLSENASPDVIRVAVQDLAAYFEDETPEMEYAGFGLHFGGCGRRYRHRYGPRVRVRAWC